MDEGGGLSVMTFLIAGVVFGVSAGFSPGPLMTLVISQTLRHGIREGAKVALAPLATDLPIVSLCLLVITQLADFRPVLGVISLVGGLFVVRLAVENFRARAIDVSDFAVSPQSLQRAVLVNVLSPHPYLFWLTVGAPLTLRAWGQGAIAAASFLAGFYICLVGSKLLAALLVGKSRHLLSGRAFVWVMRLLGVLLLFFALLLFRDGLALLGLSIWRG